MANKIVQEIRQMIEDYLNNSRWTSANPNHINELKFLGYNYEPDPENFREDTEPREPVQPLRSGLGGSQFPGINSPKDLLSLSAAKTDPLSLFNKFGGIAKLIPIIGTILALPSIINTMADLIFADGGPYDRRYKPNVDKQIAAAASKELKAKIRQGITIIRISTTPGLRGEIGIGQTGQVGLTGIPRYSQDFESFQKGII